MQSRLEEIDVLRGMAILGMIFYHFLFDLTYVGVLKINFETPLFIFFSVLVQIIFIGLAGASIYLKQQKMLIENNQNGFWSWIVRRSIVLEISGLLITLVSSLIDPTFTIYFGILHFLAAATLLSAFFISNKKNYVWIILCIVIGIFLQNMTWNTSGFIQFGIRPIEFQSFDYFPLVPWFGIVLAGIEVAKYFYPQGKRKYASPFEKYEKTTLFIFLSSVGKKSLFLYLTHQLIVFPVSLLMAKLFSALQ